MVKQKPSQNRGVKSPPRLIDVAEMAGVSVGVVSGILNGGGGNSRASAETIAKVKSLSDRLGYVPHAGARHMRGKRTFTYGILVASAGDPLRSFLVQDLDIEAAKCGRHTIICNTIGNPQMGSDRFSVEVHSLTQRGVDGVFCAVHSWWPGDREELLRVHPNTVFYEDPKIPGAVTVAVDRDAAARIAVRHLAARGYKRIALVVENMDNAVGREQLAGYREALNNLDMPFEPGLIFDGEQCDWVCGCYDNASGKWSFPVEVAEQAIEQLVVREGADAIVAHNDYWASIFIRLLHARGLRVPHDVAVIGYLNHYLADWTDPPLTSISPRHDVAARVMVEKLERMITKGSLPEAEQTTLIEPQLIQRDST